MKVIISSIFLLCILIACQPSSQISGPLRVSSENPRYLTNDTGKAILLTGSHTWNNLVDMGPSDPPAAFDFEKCLKWMQTYGHNFMRMWAWELMTWNTAGNNQANRNKDPEVHRVYPHPWARTGPGNALDGKPKFDLNSFDDAYFNRLRTRLELAREAGIYVSIMLFEGWGLQRSPNAYENHPFHAANNINGIDGDLNGDSSAVEIHELLDERINAFQKDYVRHVIDVVNDLDNILYEISNENHPASTNWQYQMIDFIHAYERIKPKQHPVGMTFQFKGGTNADLFASPAEWVSPNAEGGYRDDPPAADGSKVIITDTDHLWGIGGNPDWAWKSFCRGLHPIFMDPYDGLVLGKPFDARWEPIRRSLGQIQNYTKKLNLLEMTPQNDLASTGFCLAHSGNEYLVYLPEGGEVTIDLSGLKGNAKATWFDPDSGKTITTNISADVGLLEAPFDGKGLVLLIRK